VTAKVAAAKGAVERGPHQIVTGKRDCALVLLFVTEHAILMRQEA